jgi:hypothetical protein
MNDVDIAIGVMKGGVEKIRTTFRAWAGIVPLRSDHCKIRDGISHFTGVLFGWALDEAVYSVVML